MQKISEIKKWVFEEIKKIANFLVIIISRQNEREELPVRNKKGTIAKNLHRH